jgi:hypothetical protein
MDERYGRYFQDSKDSVHKVTIPDDKGATVILDASNILSRSISACRASSTALGIGGNDEWPGAFAAEPLAPEHSLMEVLPPKIVCNYIDAVAKLNEEGVSRF